MNNAAQVIRILIEVYIFWVACYFLVKATRQLSSWLIFIFLFCLSWYISIVDTITPLFVGHDTGVLLYKLTNFTYILPIPVLLHLVCIYLPTENRRVSSIINVIITLLYSTAIILIWLSVTTNLVINYDIILSQGTSVGLFLGRGPLFQLIAPMIVLMVSVSVWRVLAAKSHQANDNEKNSLYLIMAGLLLYGILGPILVFLYTKSSNYLLVANITAPIIVVPAVPIIIGITMRMGGARIVLRELLLAGLVFMFIALPYSIIASVLTNNSSIRYELIVVGLLYLACLTHNFYDWLTTVLRDLIYKTGSLSLITDSEVTDFVRNFHSPKNIETNSLLRFRYVKNLAKDGRMIDAAQEAIREAIGYFKQGDFPRRTKQNLKYQILKMAALDGAEEGQILWELGFDGYPMKILAGENQTRKPLFKIESMSDYTATSRNAYIALKREAIHDLTWRLSYLEKTTK